MFILASCGGHCCDFVWEPALAKVSSQIPRVEFIPCAGIFIGMTWSWWLNTGGCTEALVGWLCFVCLFVVVSSSVCLELHPIFDFIVPFLLLRWSSEDSNSFLVLYSFGRSHQGLSAYSVLCFTRLLFKPISDASQRDTGGTALRLSLSADDMG